MAYGLKVMDSAGAVIFDSTLAVGWVALGVFKFASGAAGTTISYPALAGFTPDLVDFMGSGGGLGNVAVDTTLGYPRLVVTTLTGYDRLFMLVAK